jgi:hypothetical protein
MLTRMELWDFESHEHTVFDDFSPGLNLLCGDSNAGKTSAVRALKLAAYNEFDPRSVRVGATKCKVLVETERGSVKVTRGPKDNLWEITPKGEKTQFFSKVGKDVVPMAVEILGLNVVTLGDVSVPVNIMDQLESHFMLAGVGGEKASGSMRAQIVDEISGLSGIEGLIKSVSLDCHRFGREVKETEDKMEETRKQLHDEEKLDAEQEVLDGAAKLLGEHDEYKAASVAGQATLDGWNESVEENNRLTAEADAVPDVDSAKKLLEGADVKLETAVGAGELSEDYGRWASTREKLTEESKTLPDEGMAGALLAVAAKSAGVATVARRTLLEAQEASRRVGELQAKAGETEGLEGVLELLDASGKAVGRMGAVMAADREAKQAAWGVSALKTELADCEAQLEEAEAERDAVLASVTVCPITLRPVSKECLEEAG